MSDMPMNGGPNTEAETAKYDAELGISRPRFCVPADKGELMRQVGAQPVCAAWPLLVEFVAEWIENQDLSCVDTAEELGYNWQGDMS